MGIPVHFLIHKGLMTTFVKLFTKQEYRQRNYAVSFIDPKTLIFRTITGKKITVKTKWLYYGSSSYLVPYMAELLIHMLKR